MMSRLNFCTDLLKMLVTMNDIGQTDAKFEPKDNMIKYIKLFATK